MLRKPRVAIIADIMKIETMFIKAIFKDSKTVKKIGNYQLKYNLYLYFLILQNLLISGEKILISVELRGSSRNSCIFWILFR